MKKKKKKSKASNRSKKNVRHTKSSNQKNSNVKSTNSSNRANASINKTDYQKNAMAQSKSPIPDSRTRTSATRISPYSSQSRSSINTKSSVKRNTQKTNQNWGLWFTKLTIQAALCILFYFAIYAIVTDYAGEAYDFAYQIFGDVCVEPSSDKKVKVTIPENASLKEIASLLADKELIKNEYSFYIRGKLSTNDKRVIVPGTYVLYASDNYEDILNVLTQSDNVE
ncbi:MAG: endolytic transglycosylase MltG [Lachnospiraceae bacterium]|nr:endolytic transglycosylase MltG [Lachnospiraceae bacterium]